MKDADCHKMNYYCESCDEGLITEAAERWYGYKDDDKEEKKRLKKLRKNFYLEVECRHCKHLNKITWKKFKKVFHPDPWKSCGYF
jgi:phage FluMu protein Com